MQHVLPDFWDEIANDPGSPPPADAATRSLDDGVGKRHRSARPNRRRPHMTSIRSDHDEWDISSSVGYTALLVAGWRALHASAPEPLARDQYAKHFIAASADPYLIGLLANPGTSEGA